MGKKDENTIYLLDMMKSKTDSQSHGEVVKLVSSKPVAVDEQGIPVTVDEAIEKAGIGWGTLLFMSGSLCFQVFEGVELTVIAIVGLILKCEWGLNNHHVVLIEIASFIGWMVGSFVSAAPSEVYGRRPPILVGMGGLLLFEVVSSFAASMWTFFVFRVFVGFFIGVAMGPVSVYICELSPTKYRAKLLSLAFCCYGLGMFLSMLFAYIVLGILGLTWTWYIRIMAFMFVPSIPLLYLTTEESPMFLANNQGNCKAAQTVLEKLFAYNKSPVFKMELVMRRECADNLVEKKVDNSVIIKTKGYILPIILSCTLVFGCCLCATGFSFLAPRLMNETNITSSTADHGQCQGFGADKLKGLAISEILQPITPYIAALIADKIGRRATIGGSAGVFFLSVSALHFCVDRVWFLVHIFTLFTVASALALLPYLYVAEYFPTAIRSFAMGLASSVGRVGVLVGICSSHWVYDANPRYVLGIFQTGAVGIILSIIFMKKETSYLSLE